MRPISGYNPFRRDSGSSAGRYGINVVQLVKQSGLRGILALFVAVFLAFSPLACLVWFVVVSLKSVPVTLSGDPRIKDERTEADRKEDKPGKTALLQVICEVPAGSAGWRDLPTFKDHRGTENSFAESVYVRSERVYMRPASVDAPFGLLGSPPLSAWVPAGKYEILVVYEPKRAYYRSEIQPAIVPFVSETLLTSLAAGERTVLRVPLPHHDSTWGAELFAPEGEREDTLSRQKRIKPLLDAVERTKSIATPGGVLLDLPVPVIHHTESVASTAVAGPEIRITGAQSQSRTLDGRKVILKGQYGLAVKSLADRLLFNQQS